MKKQEKIPKGYKKTEIGVIPEDWEVKRLIEAIGNQNCNIIAGPFGSNLKVSDYRRKGIPIIRLQNIEDNKFIEKDIKYISEKKAKELQYHSFKKGDLVLAKLGDPIGKTCLVPNKIKYGIVVADVVRIRVSEENDRIFLMYMLNYDSGRKQLNNDIIGTTRPRININKIRQLSIPLPPLPEQRAIAKILSDFDNLIGSLDRLIEKKKLIKKGAMQQLLSGKKRLPGFKGKWVRKRLGEVVEIVGGGTPPTGNPKYWNGNINWFTPTEIGKTKYILESNRKITIDGLRKSSARLLPVGTILFTSRATIGEVAILNREATTNQGFQSMVPLDVDNEFLYYLLSSSKYKFEEKANGSTFLEITPNAIRKIYFSFPSLPEQQAIAKILSDMDAEIEALENKKQKYEMMKKGAMELLLTGKVRVK